MATTKSTSSARSPKSRTEAPSTAALEAKVAELERKLASALSAVSALESRVVECEKCCAAVPTASGGRDEDLRTQLREYFSSATNRKVPTLYPKL